MKLGRYTIEDPVILGDAIVEIATGEREAPDGVMMITGQAEGAIPNGTRVRKVTYTEGDTFDVGTLGTVLSSLGPVREEESPDHPEIVGEYGYWVSWAPFPNTPVFTGGHKIEAVPQ